MKQIKIPDETPMPEAWTLILAQLGEIIGLDPKVAYRLAGDVAALWVARGLSTQTLAGMLNQYLNVAAEVVP